MALQLVITPPAPDPAIHARVLTDRLIHRLSLVNSAARMLRDMGYRVIAEDLMLGSHEQPSITIDRLPQQSIRRLLDQASGTKWSTDGMVGRTLYMGVTVIWTTQVLS